jgi:hypothetical protein
MLQVRVRALTSRAAATSHSPIRRGRAVAVTGLRARYIRRESANPPPGMLAGPPPPVAQQHARGLKRSRSPENSYADVPHGDDGGT